MLWIMLLSSNVPITHNLLNMLLNVFFIPRLACEVLCRCCARIHVSVFRYHQYSMFPPFFDVFQRTPKKEIRELRSEEVRRWLVSRTFTNDKPFLKMIWERIVLKYHQYSRGPQSMTWKLQPIIYHSIECKLLEHMIYSHFCYIESSGIIQNLTDMDRVFSSNHLRKHSI